MNLWVVIPLAAALLGLRLLRPNLLIWLLAWWAALFGLFRFGLATPAPQSVVTMYMAISTLALVAYALSSRERTRQVVGPLVTLMTERKYLPALVLVLVALPAAAGVLAWRRAHVQAEAPYFARTVHPAPPPTITVGEGEVDLIRADNPYRKLQETDPEAYRERVASGRATYYKNCFYCHGDALAGDGMFAHGLDPIPTNFTDAGILPNFQESFFFWRVAKGAPGMPEEGGPWDSAMPRWEQFLSEEEMWEVVLFLYDFTGREPREVGEFVHE